MRFSIRRRTVWLWRALALAVFLVLILPAIALAVAPAPTLVFPGKQVWVLIIGGLVPLVTYVVNHVGPWLTEPIKATVLAVVAAIAGALYTAIDTNVFGANTATLELVLSAVIAAFTVHHLIWRPSGISTILGGGTNRVDPPPAKRRRVVHHADPPAPQA